MTTKNVTIQMPAKDASRLDDFLKDFGAAVVQAKKRMRRDQVEIEKYKAETRAMLKELKAMR